jgi:DNA-directed RNA polymerase subunit M/transcription elongation factor TFIIS
MSKTAPCILLTQKAEVKQGKIPLQSGSLTLEAVQTLLKKKELPEILGTYRYKALTLTLLGYTSGKAGTENKHELPPPFDNTLCFGDILLLASTYPASYTKPVAFKPEDYEAFYTKMFGGFEDLDSDEEEEAEEAEEAEEPEVKEKIIVEELDEDGEDDENDEVSEEDEAEAEAEVEADAEPEVEEEPVRPVKISKKKRAAAAAQNGTSQILHIPKDQHLLAETVSTAASYPKRVQALESIKTVLAANKMSDIDIVELERCIYNSTLVESQNRHVTCHWNNSLFNHNYLTRVRHILGNLIPSSYVENTRLLHDLRAGKYTLEQVCSMDTYSLCNERWRDFIHRRVQREKRQLEGNKAMATDQFYCKACHKRECTYYEMQTRSADEPMTIFITCMNCGKHWRQ